MRRLIVNGDDFGLSPGVNRGIVEAHDRGILTSASLMVRRPGAEDAAGLARERPRLSVGLHAELDGLDPDEARAELDTQLDRFRALVGSEPTHLDSHHNVHLSDGFAEVFAGYGIPVRGRSAARYVRDFYGDVGLDALERVLTDLPEGLSELGCHPGYADEALSSSYTRERERELETLCDPAARELLDRLGIELASFHGLPR